MENHKKEESEFQLTTEKYSELFSISPFACIILSKEGGIIKINESAANLLRRNSTKHKDASIDFFISDETKPVFNSFFKKVFNSKAKESCEVQLADNGKAPVYILLTAIAPEKEKVCLLYLFDITERKLSEEALKKKNDKLEWINEIMIAREIRMIELKNEVNGLLNSLGKDDKYKIH